MLCEKIINSGQHTADLLLSNARRAKFTNLDFSSLTPDRTAPVSDNEIICPLAQCETGCDA